MTSGTNTRTGNRNTNLARRNETPERFLQPNDPTRLLRQSQQAATDDAFQQRFFAQQNQQDAYNRQRNAAIEAAQREENAKINDFNRRMQEKESDARQANRTVRISAPLNRQILDDSTINFNRQQQQLREQRQYELTRANRDRYNQQILEQQRQANERTMQGAQLAAQQRLAQIQQDTAILSGNTGESTWRWF